jgi:hypothetical protein
LRLLTWEGRRHRPGGGWDIVIRAGSVAAALYVLWIGALATLTGNAVLWLAAHLHLTFLVPFASWARAFTAQFHLDIAIFVAITFPIAFLTTTAGPWRRRLAWTDVVLAGMSLSVGLYYIVLNDRFLHWSRGFTQPTFLDIAVGLTLVVLVVELCRRSTGWGLTTAARGAARVHGVRLVHAGRAAARQLRHRLFHRDDDRPVRRHFRRPARGGRELRLSVRAVRQLLQQGRRRATLLRLGERSDRAHARRCGQGLRHRERPVWLGVRQPDRGCGHHGPAHDTDHDQQGVPPARAAAIEATSSSGGAMLPPVMGAVAFIMADITNIPYSEIVAASWLPSILYYVAIYILVHNEAVRNREPPMPDDQIVPLQPGSRAAGATSCRSAP